VKCYLRRSQVTALYARNDYVKSLHSTLLRQLGVDATRTFWSQHPLTVGERALSERELALHVWNETAHSPVAWVLSVIGALEPFLIERGASPDSFEAAMRILADHETPSFGLLRFVHAETAEKLEALQREREEMQRRYLEAATELLRVVFFDADCSVAVADQHVCRGVPALLLRECVRIACAEGRHEFSFRELKRLPRLISHPKNTGFETRLSRLRSALEHADCGMSIALAGRGKFVLKARGRLELVEHTQRE
jgi:hypothetical protein